MIGKLLSSTKIHNFDKITAEELVKICRFTVNKSEKLRIAFVIDARPFALRDNLIKEVSTLYECVVFDKVVPDPKTADINEMFTSLCDGLQANSVVDLVIGIGGGSTLDSAKALAMLSAHIEDEKQIPLLDDFLGASPKRKIENKSIPLILIPTTTGTGSEVTKVGVYTSESGRKYTLGSPLMQAHVALLVTEFVATLPASLTASTGFDALSHALESIWNKNATPITLEAAQDAALIILRVLEKNYDVAIEIEELAKKSSEDAQAYAYRQDTLNIRTDLLTGAMLAGIAFSITGTASVHALSFILSEQWHIPHGTACAFTLEDVFLMNAADTDINERLLALAKRAFGEDATIQTLLNEIVRLKKKMGQPRHFSDIGIKITEQEIKEKFAPSFEDPKMLNNKPPAQKEIIYAMLEKKIG